MRRLSLALKIALVALLLSLVACGASLMYLIGNPFIAPQ